MWLSLFLIKFRSRHLQMFFKIIVLKKFCEFHRKIPVSEPCVLRTCVLRTATLLIRDSNSGFFLWISGIIQEHLFYRDLWTAGSETPAAFLRAPCFTEHLQWLLLTFLGFQPASLLKKRRRHRCFSVNFAEFLRSSFDRTHLDDCFWCLSVNFEQ